MCIASLVGSRTCGYFQKAFLKKPNSNNVVIWVPLISQACEVVPHLLDYLYDWPTFPLRTNTAAGLAYIAEYVHQPTLLQRTLELVHQDLNSDTLHRYWIDDIRTTCSMIPTQTCQEDTQSQEEKQQRLRG
jgi:hypothetical protein